MTEGEDASEIAYINRSKEAKALLEKMKKEILKEKKFDEK